MNHVARAAWVLGVLFYIVDVTARVRGYVGFVPKVDDAIAMLLIAGVGGVLWRPDSA